MFGFGFQGLGGSRGAASTTNMCWQPIGSSGDERGFLTASFGTMYPTTTSDGTFIYRTSFNVTTGLFIFSFGVAGDERLDNTGIIIYEYNGTKLDLVWDKTNEDYRGTNTSLATELDALGLVNTCFLATVVPEKIFSFDYQTIEMEA